MRVLLSVLVLCTALAQCGYSPGAAQTAAVGQFNPRFSSGPDFNPVLLQGNKGYPGIRARVNERAFQYASTLLGGVLNSEIKKARIPPISQCIPMVSGCIQIYNLYVSRYRCPQRVVLYPAPPNRVILQVQNVDLGVTGNLGGQIVVLLPIALTGIVQLNVHQATITVDLAVEQGPSGPYLRMNSCNVNIGYADAYIENGGLIGDIVNSQFRSQISNQVKQMIPGQICNQLPTIINEKINSKLNGLPKAIAVSQMLSMFGGALGLGGNDQCSASCGAGSKYQRAVVLPSVASVPVATPALAPSGAAPAPQIPTNAYHSGSRRVYAVPSSYNTNQHVLQGLVPNNQVRHYRAVQYHPEQRTLYVPVGRAKRQAVAQQVYLHQVAQQSRHVVKARGAAPYPSGGQLGAAPRIPPPPSVAVAPPQAPPPNDCSKCPQSAQEDPASFLKQVAAHLDMTKLNDLYLSVQLLNSYATSNDFTIDLTGEFSPNAQGGTPFGAFPTQFPSAYGNQMAEFIVTDYTVNSLFYHLHRKQFLSFRIGPDTPKIGELLKTTCSDDDDDLEATEVELDEEEARRKRRLATSLSHKSLRSRRDETAVATIAPTITTITRKKKRDSRKRRQDDDTGLADLGICFGDILPAVREKYPNQKIAIVIRTKRAPSVILSSAKGGSATLDLIADADIYIDGTNTKVGTITIAATVVVVIQINGNRLSGSAEITNLQLTDQEQTLGLPQDALDNLGNLGKELLQKVANDALQKGVAFSIPQNLPLPIGIINPTVRIVEHGLYIGTDFTVSPSLLGGGGGGC